MWVPGFQAKLRPLKRCTTKQITTIINKMWINPPATWKAKNPSSLKGSNPDGFKSQEISTSSPASSQPWLQYSLSSATVHLQAGCGAFLLLSVCHGYSFLFNAVDGLTSPRQEENERTSSARPYRES